MHVKHPVVRHGPPSTGSGDEKKRVNISMENVMFSALYFEGDQTEPRLEPDVSKYQITYVRRLSAPKN